MKPLISIIIACYKGEPFLAATLDSVLAQTFSEWECIIVDDGSPDRCADIGDRYASRDSRFRVLRKSNGGVGDARNAGVANASPFSEMLVFLDQDDVWRPHALQILRAALVADPTAVAAHALADFIDEQGKPLDPGAFADFGRKNRLGFDGRGIVTWPLDKPTCFEVLINSFTLYPPGAALLRRSAFDQVGGFDPFYKHGGEDWDLFVRLSRLGHLPFINNVVIDYRRHSFNGTNDTRRMRQLTSLVRRRFFYSTLNMPQHVQVLRSSYRAWQIFKIRTKTSDAIYEIRRRSPLALVKLPIHVVVHVARLLCGRPLRFAQEA